MKTNVIILIFVAIICIQCELSSGGDTSAKNTSRLRRRVTLRSPSMKSRSKSKVKPVVINNNIAGLDDDKTSAVETIIKGDKGVIKVDGKNIEKNDQDFKNGDLRVSISRGCIYINDNLILEREPSSPNNFSATNISGKGIKNFEIRVKKNGLVHYTDNKRIGTINIRL